MGCGCRKNAPPDEQRRTRAAMCHVCPESVSGYTADGARGAVACTVGGSWREARCPLGMFPDRRGRVRWLGIRWRGVPMPLRVLVYMSRPGTRRLWGCGCVDAIKRRLEAWRVIS